MPTRTKRPSLSIHVIERLRKTHVLRAMRRQHRPCKTCDTPVVVCTMCSRTYCLLCDSNCKWGCLTPSVSPGTGVEQPRIQRSKSSPRRRTTPTIVPLSVPGALQEFQQGLLELGWHLKSFNAKPDGKFDVQVFCPSDTYQKPNLDNWFGWTVSSYSKQGLKEATIQATLRK